MAKISREMVEKARGTSNSYGAVPDRELDTTRGLAGEDNLDAVPASFSHLGQDLSLVGSNRHR